LLPFSRQLSPISLRHFRQLADAIDAADDFLFDYAFSHVTPPLHCHYHFHFADAAKNAFIFEAGFRRQARLPLLLFDI